VCWGAKGGSGTTVVAAALGLCLPPPVMLVDLAGDMPAVLGLSEPAGPGVHEWLISTAPAQQLLELGVHVAAGVTLIPAGRHRTEEIGVERWDTLVTALTADDHHLIVDAGTGPPPAALHELADRSLLVIRACYLALRRAVTAGVCPSGVVLVDEPGRALRAVDIETAVGAPLVATVAIDPTVARAVDAGLLASRLPRSIQRDLRGAA
jgi:hypothetical protein